MGDFGHGGGGYGTGLAGASGLDFGSANPQGLPGTIVISPILEALGTVYGLWSPEVNTFTSGGNVTSMGAYSSGRIAVPSTMKWEDGGGAAPALTTGSNGKPFLDGDGATEDLVANAALLDGNGTTGWMNGAVAGTGYTVFLVLDTDVQISEYVNLNRVVGGALNQNRRLHLNRGNTAIRYFMDQAHPDGTTITNDGGETHKSALRVMVFATGQDGTANNVTYLQDDGTESLQTTEMTTPAGPDPNTAYSSTDPVEGFLLSFAGSSNFSPMDTYYLALVEEEMSLADIRLVVTELKTHFSI